MRALIWIVSIAAVLYGGYWFAGSRAVRSGTEAALTDLRAEGLAEFDRVSLRGFPSRFDLTIDNPVLRNASGSVEWRAPFLQLFALSYRPNHLIAVWPDTQALRLSGQDVSVTSEDIRASAVFGASLSTPLKRSQLVGKEMRLGSDAARWGVLIRDLRLATRLATDRDLAHDLGVDLLGLTPSAALRRTIDPTSILPESAEWFRVRATIGFDGPLDRHAGEAGLRITDLWLDEVSLRWGELEMRADGVLSVSPDGIPDGRITLQARRWREMLRLAVAANAVRPEIAPTIENVLAQLAKLSGSPDEVELPLVFSGGRMALGPIPLGPAPRF